VFSVAWYVKSHIDLLTNLMVKFEQWWLTGSVV